MAIFKIKNNELIKVNNIKIERAKVPSNVYAIGWHAFENCTSLESVIIPDSVKTIGLNAFHGCTSLKEIKIPNSVKSIGHGAFGHCSDDLKKLVFEQLSEDCIWFDS